MPSSAVYIRLFSSMKANRSRLKSCFILRWYECRWSRSLRSSSSIIVTATLITLMLFLRLSSTTCSRRPASSSKYNKLTERAACSVSCRALCSIQTVPSTSMIKTSTPPTIATGVVRFRFLLSIRGLSPLLAFYGMSSLRVSRILGMS